MVLFVLDFGGVWEFELSDGESDEKTTCKLQIVKQETRGK